MRVEAKPSPYFFAGGTLPDNVLSYLERRADADLLAALEAGEFCYVLDTRQVGKSSLMVRVAQRLRDAGYQAAILDLSSVGENLTQEQWYYGLLNSLAITFDMEEEAETFWLQQPNLGCAQRWFAALHKVFLSHLNAPLIVFVDELDAVRKLSFSVEEFFAMIRESHNRRAYTPEARRMTFCLLGVATPSDLIQDVRTTPFNIGRRIELHDFAFTEMQPLAAGFQCGPFLGHALLERVFYWTGGHPYLTQLLCQEITLHPETLTPAHVDRLCYDLFLSPAAQERDTNLTFVRDRLLKSDVDLAELLGLYDQVYHASKIHHNRANPLIDVLMLSGLVRAEQGELVVRNRIYSHVFDRNWIRNQMPDAEKRRQRAAFLRGAFRVAAIALVLLSIIGSLGLVAIKQAHRAMEAEKNATRQAHRAMETEKNATRLLYAADMNVTQQALKDNNTGRVLELLDEQRPKPGQEEDLRGFEWRYFWRLCHGAARTLRGHTDLVRSVAYSRGGILASGGDDNTIHLWNVVAGTSETLRGHKASAYALAFSPDGTVLASGSLDHTVRLWDMRTKRELRTLSGHTKPVKAIAFSPDGKLLASAGDDFTIRLWDTKTWTAVATIPTHQNELFSIAFSKNSNVLACSGCGTIQLWDVANRCIIRTLAMKDVHGKAVNVFSLAFSHHDGWLLAAGQEDGDIKIWDTERPENPRIILTAHTFAVNSLAFSPDDKMLASGSWDDIIHLWRFPKQDEKGVQSEPFTLKDHAGMVNAVAFSPDGKTLASGSNDTTVKLWNAEPEHLAAYQEMLPLTSRHKASPYQGVYSLAFSLDGHTLDSSFIDGSILLWKTDKLHPEPPLPIDGALKYPAVFSLDGRMMALLCKDHTIRLWDMTTMHKREWPFDDKEVFPAAFSPDGKLLASGTGDYTIREFTIRLWDTDSRRLIHTFRGHTNAIGTLTFSPDGKLLASG
ncbi:MAG TPA: AAA-like domain-containing protein, partial [Chthonomonadaceae bacterium]|nr:AAA-like domain-containing protein [Chthonomonadaceae bacterium]